VTAVIDVPAGGAAIVASVATGWKTGAGADWVHPVERKRAMRRRKIPVLRDFINCILYR
jgi:hypothetical protein